MKHLVFTKSLSILEGQFKQLLSGLCSYQPGKRESYFLLHQLAAVQQHYGPLAPARSLCYQTSGHLFEFGFFEPEQKCVLAISAVLLCENLCGCGREDANNFFCLTSLNVLSFCTFTDEKVFSFHFEVLSEVLSR